MERRTWLFVQPTGVDVERTCVGVVQIERLVDAPLFQNLVNLDVVTPMLHVSCGKLATLATRTTARHTDPTLGLSGQR